MTEKNQEAEKRQQLIITLSTDSQDFYEQLVTDYPTCGRFWKAYIEHELFQRCILKVLNVELWRCYLNYVRDVKIRMANHKEKTAQAYDFALDKIGLDVQSYSIWVDYINFLKSVEAIGSFAENQKITAIRKVYQKGVMNPMLNVDQLWKDYCIFENQINPLIAKRMIDDRSRDYMSVRKIAKEYENVTRLLDRQSPGLPIPTGTPDELRQKQLWRKYIEWERASPTLRGVVQANATSTGSLVDIESSLAATTSPASLYNVAKRVMYAYEQWLLAMPKHPDIWVEYAAYLQEQSARMADKSGSSGPNDKSNGTTANDVGAWARVYAQEAVQVFERALAVCAQSPLVYFAYADFEEGRLNYTKVKEIYDKLLEIQELDPSLCYIQYMRFLRRVEGIRSARTIFKRAREDSRTSYHVYVAAAFMEYYCTKDISIAHKIFQSGMKQFNHIPEFVLAFIELIKHMNDNDAVRELFESVLESGTTNGTNDTTNSQMTKEKLEQIWLEWLDFERNANTSLAIIDTVANRRQSFYETTTPSLFAERQSLLLIDRYSYDGLRPCTRLELTSIGYPLDAATPATTTVAATSPPSLLNLDLQPLQTTASSSSSTSTSTATAGAATTATVSHSPPSPLSFEESNTSAASSDPTSASNKRKKTLTAGGYERRSLPEPDPNRMIAFKPSRRSEFGFMQPIPGGGLFLFPSIFSDLIKRLPPPPCFQGPFVVIDEFISRLKNLDLPDDFEKFQMSHSIKDMRVGEQDGVGDGDDDDDDENSNQGGGGGVVNSNSIGASSNSSISFSTNRATTSRRS